MESVFLLIGETPATRTDSGYRAVRMMTKRSRRNLWIGGIGQLMRLVQLPCRSGETWMWQDQVLSTMFHRHPTAAKGNGSCFSPVRILNLSPFLSLQHSRSFLLASDIDYHDYLERMNTHTYEIVDAAIRHPDISRLDVWGPKWRYWDPTVALSENVRRRMWWLDELEKRSLLLQPPQGRKSGTAADSVDGNQIRAEELMTREEMDAWWLAVKDGRSELCPPKGFDLVWTIS